MNTHVDVLPMGARTRFKICVDGYDDPLVLDTPSRGEVGNVFLELGSKRTTTPAPLLAHLMKAASEWFENNWPNGA